MTLQCIFSRKSSPTYFAHVGLVPEMYGLDMSFHNIIIRRGSLAPGPLTRACSRPGRTELEYVVLFDVLSTILAKHRAVAAADVAPHGIVIGVPFWLVVGIRCWLVGRFGVIHARHDSLGRGPWSRLGICKGLCIEFSIGSLPEHTSLRQNASIGGCRRCGSGLLWVDAGRCLP